MKHLSTYRLFESITPIQQEVIDDVTNILADLSDDGYVVKVEMREENQIIADSYMDMDVVSDSLIRLYDYMKEHQTAFNRNPSNASVSVSGPPGRETYPRYFGIGWGQLDYDTLFTESNPDDLEDFTTCIHYEKY